MNDAQHRHGVVVLGMPVDDDVRRDDTDTNILTERGTWCAYGRVIGETFVKPVKQPVIPDRRSARRPRGLMLAKNDVRVCVGT